MQQQTRVEQRAFFTEPSAGIAQPTHPGVYLPPPFIYAGFFFFSLAMGKLMPLDASWLHSAVARSIGSILIVLFVLLAFAAIRQFIRSKNTLVTIKPATSLQTTGIYAMTRNPMYLSLLLLYAGLGVLKGNCWTLVLIPFLALTVQLYVIRKEERYLNENFGQAYHNYRKKVRRWI